LVLAHGMIIQNVLEMW